MKTFASNTSVEPLLDQEYTAFLLSLLRMQKLPEVVTYLYSFQSELDFSSLHLALLKEDNKHLRVEKPALGKRMLLHSNGPIEERVFREERKVILETADSKTWLALPLHNR